MRGRESERERVRVGEREQNIISLFKPELLESLQHGYIHYYTYTQYHKKTHDGSLIGRTFCKPNTFPG